jgi:hypothetical protein
MDSPPPNTHSFVVRIWPKRVEGVGEDASWRGSITHVEAGERRYLEDLIEVPRFIAPYIIEAGGTLDWRSRLLLWRASESLRDSASG